MIINTMPHILGTGLPGNTLLILVFYIKFMILMQEIDYTGINVNAVQIFCCGLRKSRTCFKASRMRRLPSVDKPAEGLDAVPILNLVATRILVKT
jgi:hypothetical protein